MSAPKLIVKYSKPPCFDKNYKDCPERHVGCQIDCKKYILWKQENTKKWEQAHARMMYDQIGADYDITTAMKLKKKKR